MRHRLLNFIQNKKQTVNIYLVEQKISTLSQLSDPFSYKGFEFQQWGYNSAEGCIGQAWVAKKAVTAINVKEAFYNFRKELNPIVERFGFTSQCYFAVGMQSYMIVKKNDNPDNIFLLFFSSERMGVSLHFDEAVKKALEKLEGYENQPVFTYMNESTKASTYYTRLAMLIIALESIAGEINNKGGHKKTDTEYIKKKIIKDDILYNKVFGYGEGIRNKIFHGKEVEDDDEYVETIYNKIINYFNEKYNISIDTCVVHPQRSPIGNYSVSRVWLKPKNKTQELNLKDVVELFEKEHGSSSKRAENNFDKLFSLIEAPEGAL